MILRCLRTVIGMVEVEPPLNITWLWACFKENYILSQNLAVGIILFYTSQILLKCTMHINKFRDLWGWRRAIL